MRSIKQVGAAIARRRSTVLIGGETGTGKEMLARYLHELSDRADQPFIPVDCSALTDTLFESELFGHVCGAFTNAVRDTLGFVRAADGGTLFLDEIGELSLQLQAKLLRVLQERCVVPVGGVKPIPVDVRVVAATNRDLAEMVAKGLFRQDLFFRLNVVGLTVAPLRQRPEDIVPLARHFLAMQAAMYAEPVRQLAPEAVELLQRYSWPGNVRELANAMEHAHVLAVGIESVGPEALPPQVHAAATTPQPCASDSLLLQDVERRTIAEALRRSRYCKTAASRLLGISIPRLNRRIQHLGIPVVARHAF
jgi:transcriptional regulator with PAS, ATPase and Fis domain